MEPTIQTKLSLYTFFILCYAITMISDETSGVTAVLVAKIITNSLEETIAVVVHDEYTSANGGKPLISV